MNDILDKASSHLTGKPSITHTNTDELEKLAFEYPYFSAAQVLLAKKYKAENHLQLISQVHKTALHFNNPYWLHFQLLEENLNVSFENETGTVSTADESIDQKKNELVNNVDELQPQERIFTKDEIFAASTLARETLTNNEVEVQHIKQEQQEVVPDELHPEQEEILEEISEQSSEQTLEEIVEAHTEQLEVSDIEPADASEVSDFTKDENNQGDHEPNKVQTEDLSNPEIGFEEPIVEKDLIETVVEENLVNPLPIEESINVETAESSEAVSRANQEVSTTPTPEAVVSNEPLIPIEPYYTVDYFASQGIKLVLDKNPQDKLGKQLRSFTDWLKHMKKLGPEDALKPAQDTDVDPAVKKIADTSNKQKEILTEAMADVLIKQGKTEQAIELYHKLSFLNPDKSTYFANQIQKLKGI